MDSSNNPIGSNPNPKDPFEPYRVDPIPADKKSKEDSNTSSETPAPPYTSLGSYLLALVHKFINFLISLSQSKKESNPKNKTFAITHLILFRTELERLKSSDLSQNSGYLNHLCDLWHAVLDDSLSVNRNDPIASLLYKFIKQIDSYPQSGEYSFGYYLTEYAGQKWLPFPYIELVQKIYALHQQHPETSPLTLWIHEIDSIILLFDPDLL